MQKNSVALLAELARTPSDNPAGDCRADGEKTASLLKALGLAVERHAVPAALCKRHGMVTPTNLIVRKRFGAGPTIALSAHGIPILRYGAGPRTIEDANAHRADERLQVSDLAKATEVIALILHDLLR